MDIVLLRTFLAAASTGSFANAALRVNASASTVTERIRQLEHRVGARLFERDKRGCRLTAAGKRFHEPALKAIRTWEIACHDIALPEAFSRSIAIGGQYALWHHFLTDWLATARAALPDVAFRVTAGASARLNRDIVEGLLDLVVLYDPVFRKGITVEKLFDDDLVLVSGAGSDDWQAHYVRIEWGQGTLGEIAARLPSLPESGLILDLGIHSARWLVEQRMCGFMPRRVVQDLLDSGDLRLVEGAPRFHYPAYMCWRGDVDQDLVKDLARLLRSPFAGS
ncbi:LysR family transcriptional regulator [Rhizorhabdus wittichii DC-6]|uniref:Transcriptional regulator, LysR family n=1 Tax=Rhizorhabdus wittichii (strain DSM 6014 / CCUG 31198 / JCM 15750 / NBRC 105917 / EY 4224 / RW1) TaxID=392499 RepID=A0A9J9H7W1_RHIWR|nr:transcriptional regulator, LysR family [Rhizorhabdus wittichii RW1]ARR56856.1 LysR family transcriptional regulator [Rhizorhabdus wittichii DC-6]